MSGRHQIAIAALALERDRLMKLQEENRCLRIKILSLRVSLGFALDSLGWSKGDIKKFCKEKNL